MSDYKGWRRLFRSDKDFDFGFLLILEKRKLQNMLKYFSSDKVYVNTTTIVRDIKLAIKCLEIYNDDDYLQFKVVNPYYTGYVNLGNSKRFIENIDNINEGNTIRKHIIREEKAWHLYNLIREYKMRTWWD